MDNNLISNILQLERTNLIRGGTGNSYASFELKLQLHGQVSNPYTVSVKQNYKASAIINVDVPAYTEKSWTTPGTYTWTVPAGVTRARVAVCGGGGGGTHNTGTGGTGGTSVIKNNTVSIIQATGGYGGEVFYNDGYEVYEGSGGTPNGRAGTAGYSSDAQGGTGFALSFTLTNGTYGQGGGAQGGIRSNNAGGGSGGYNCNYINVNVNTTYSITVGAGGSKADDKSYNGNSGFVLIAYGQGIE